MERLRFFQSMMTGSRLSCFVLVPIPRPKTETGQCVTKRRPIIGRALWLGWMRTACSRHCRWEISTIRPGCCLISILVRAIDADLSAVRAGYRASQNRPFVHRGSDGGLVVESGMSAFGVSGSTPSLPRWARGGRPDLIGQHAGRPLWSVPRGIVQRIFLVLVLF